MDDSKILFLSLLIYSIFEYIMFGNKYPNFWFSKSVTLIFAPLLFIFSSYFFDTLIGDVFMLVHLISFVAAIVFGQMMSYYFIQNELYFRLMNVLAVFLLLFTFVAFSSYTINPTLLPIFDPMEEYTNIITR